MEYNEWRANSAEKTEEKALKTLDKILDENSNCRLYSQDLDDVKDCLKIISMCRSLRHGGQHDEGSHADHHAAMPMK